MTGGGRYIVVGLTHLLCVGLVLKMLAFMVPTNWTECYTDTAQFLVLLIVGKATFCFTKRKFLSERIQADNKAVFITGCDSGFGHSLAQLLDKKGYQVFASCLNATGSGATDLTRRCSKRLQTLQMDVASDESVKKAVEFVKENLGTSEFWAIVNNAGIHKGLTYELTSLQDFRDSFEINTLGHVRVTQAFLPLLRQSRGRIVNLISRAGRVSVPHLSPYCMSKFAAAALNDCLRQELKVWGIRVVAIEPEFFSTPMTDSENLGKRLEESFSQIDPDVLSDYGEKYLQQLKMFFEYIIIGICSPKVERVLNSIEKAISLEEPDAVYSPDRNCLVTLFFTIYNRLPIIIKDSLLGLLVGFPKPKEAENNL